jgi:hypothetical protein
MNIEYYKSGIIFWLWLVLSISSLIIGCILIVTQGIKKFEIFGLRTLCGLLFLIAGMISYCMLPEKVILDYVQLLHN